MLHTEYRSFWSCGFRDKDYYMFFPIISFWQTIKSPGHGWQDFERRFMMLIHTNHEGSGPCGLGQDILMFFSHCKSMGAIC